MEGGDELNPKCFQVFLSVVLCKLEVVAKLSNTYIISLSHLHRFRRLSAQGLHFHTSAFDMVAKYGTSMRGTSL